MRLNVCELPTTTENFVVRVSVSYDKDGRPRGYYLSIMLVERENGFETVRLMGGETFRGLIETTARFNQRRLTELRDELALKNLANCNGVVGVLQPRGLRLALPVTA